MMYLISCEVRCPGNFSRDFGSLVCSRDGDYLFYEDLGPPHKISRISVKGGESVDVAKVLGEFLLG